MVSLVSLGLRSFLLAIHWRIRAICPQQTHKCSLIKGSDEWAAHSCVPITFQFMLPCAISSYLPFAMYQIRSMANAKEKWRRREAESDVALEGLLGFSIPFNPFYPYHKECHNGGR